MSKLIILPCYNEADSFPVTLIELPREVPERSSFVTKAVPQGNATRATRGAIEGDSAGNAATLAAFRGRKVWVHEADRLPRQLVPWAEDSRLRDRSNTDHLHSTAANAL